MTDPMDTTTVERALRRMADAFDFHMDVEVLLVGGAAGMLTGVLEAGRTTVDCDVMLSAPPGAAVRLEEVARSIAPGEGLPATWLNDDASLVRWKLPEGWRERRVPVLERGRLRVFAASRVDLIALKALAGRDQDIEDLRTMRVTAQDAAFVRTHLDGYDNTPAGAKFAQTIADARTIIDAMEGDHAA